MKILRAEAEGETGTRENCTIRSIIVDYLHEILEAIQPRGIICLRNIHIRNHVY